MTAFEKFNRIFGTDCRLEEDEDWFDIHKPGTDAWKVKEKLESPSYACKYCSDSKLEKFGWDYSRNPRLRDYLVAEESV